MKSCTALNGLPTSRTVRVLLSYWAEIAVGFRPLVPNRYATLLKPFRVAVTAQEPQEFVGDAFPVHLLRRQQRKATREIKAHLRAEHRTRAGARTVALLRARGADLLQQFEVRLLQGGEGGGRRSVGVLHGESLFVSVVQGLCRRGLGRARRRHGGAGWSLNTRPDGSLDCADTAFWRQRPAGGR